MILAAGAYAVTRLQGPQGVPALLEKHKIIRQLEDQNQLLRDDIMKRELRNQDLLKDDVIDLEIRKRFHMLKKKEREFQFQGAPQTK
jgi:hypothetical protein